MKHGTCKFGQACKFDHPPQSSLALLGGGTVVMANMGRNNKDLAPQIVMSNDGNGNTTPMMLQFLPQRPDEQDCIYFLKNGRCKYGATCRYHHPINYNSSRSVGVSSSNRQDDRRPRMQVQQVLPEGYIQQSNVQFISPQGGYTKDGPVTYIVDGSSGKGSYHPNMSVVTSDGYCGPTGAAISHNQDHTSSTSSIASSYDTANSNLDHFVSHGGDQSQSSGLWNRQKNNGSHASLNNAYDSSSSRRLGLPPSASEGSIASRQRMRATSFGSANDGTYMDAGQGNIAGRAGPGGPTQTSWRTDVPPSFDNGRNRSNSGQFRSQGEMMNSDSHHSNGQGQPQQQFRQQGRGPPIQGRMPNPGSGSRRASTEQVDQGLSMMTSALLTMLDTTEEVQGEDYEYDYEEVQYNRGGHMPSTDMGTPMMHTGVTGRSDAGLPRGRDMNSDQRESNDGRSYGIHQEDRRLNGDMFDGMTMNPPLMDRLYHDNPPALNTEEGANWLPNWQGTKSVGPGSLQHSHTPNAPQDASNVGLFLR